MLLDTRKGWRSEFMQRLLREKPFITLRSMKCRQGFFKKTFSHGSDLQARADLSAIPFTISPYLRSGKYPSLESLPITDLLQSYQAKCSFL
jgi:hypothetical protein